MKINIVAILLLLWTMTYGQPVNSVVREVDVPTPQAVSFGKFGEIPVDYSTGIPDISIPIHKIDEGPLSIPLSLRYHSGGIKVSEIPGWVGSGWNLNTGGIVSRVVQGMPDDGVGGFYYFGDSLNVNDNAHKVKVLLGERDGEPDLFSYSIPGYSGKFFIDKDHVIRQIPLSDVKIEVTEILGTQQFGQLTVTDPTGTRYIFGYFDDNGTVRHAREIVEPDTEIQSSHISSWLLVRVESFDRLFHIDYYYNEDDYSYDYPRSCTLYTISTPLGCNGSPSPICPGDIVIIADSYALDRIETSTEVISFSGDHEGLDSIQIQSGSFCKEWIFSYDQSIFGDRLTLTDLQEASCDATIELPPYEFEYYNSPTVDRSSNMVDHWGYYNGATGNDNLSSGTINIPLTEVLGEEKGSSDRETNSSVMVSGTLKTISYPTGGSTTFAYEANDYQTTLYTTPVTVLNLNTTEGAAGCTPDSSVQGEYTFSSQAEVDNAHIFLTLNPVEECIVIEENYFTLSLDVEKYISGTWSMVGNVNFESMSTTQDTTSGAFVSINDTILFTPGLYRFTLTTVDAPGSFTLTTTTPYQGNKPVGGLRIAQITTEDGITNQDIVKSYQYRDLNDTSVSSGVLLRMPIYGTSVNGVLIANNTYGGSYSFSVFKEDNIIPLSTLEGYHIHYQSVTEFLNGGTNGSTSMVFDTEYTGLSLDFPIEPGIAAVRRGKLLNSTMKSANGVKVMKSGISPRTPVYSYSGDYLKPLIAHTYTDCGGIGFDHVGALNSYDLRTAAYQIESQQDTLDDVPTTTNYTYDPTSRFLGPISTSMTNSDGKVHKTEYIYPHDVAGAAYDSLVSINKISPVQTLQKVDSDIVDGTSTVHALFNTANGLFPYPQQYKRHEVTWQGTTRIDAGEVTQATIHTYDNATGFPDSLSIQGWQPSTYVWNTNGTLSCKSFLGYTTSYAYHSGTKLLQSLTAIDGTSTTYTWDPLMRLLLMTDCQGVEIQLDYRYGSGYNDQNYIHTTITYPKFGSASITNKEIINTTFFDGLGRHLQSIAFNQDPNDIIVSIIQSESKYDSSGRLTTQFEPLSAFRFEGTFITGTNADSTLTTYEASPLNRPVSNTPPSWYATTMNYGSNAANEVYNHQTSSYFPANTLYKQTTIDPEGQATEVFTDKRGNSILSRVKKSASSTASAEIADTYTLFDDKDRPSLVLPPQTTTSENNLIFKTLYSGDDQVISQDNPDQEPITMVYNERDLLTYRQDGNMKADNRWYAYTYDDYGHVLTEGWATDSLSIPTDILIQNTWATTGAEKGKLKAEAIKLLNDPNNFTLQKEYIYDLCGRLIVTNYNSILHPIPGSIIDSMVLDSRGVAIEKYQIIIPDGITIKHRHTYDHAGREKKSYIQITTPEQSWPEQELSEKSYTVKEQISDLNLGAGLQNVDYSYTPNRLLSQINTSYSDFLNINDPVTGTKDLFGLTIGYNTSIDNGFYSSVTPLKDGNISHIQWSYRKPDNTTAYKQRYAFSYDFLKMLTLANDRSSSGVDKYTTTYAYADHRGNLSNVTRKSAGSMIDNLSYTLHPGTNKIKAITDGSSLPFQKKGYKANTGSDFTYDANGAMDYDAGRGVDIEVNHLDLPNQIIVPDSNGMVMYYYSADGMLKRQEEIRDSVVYKVRDYIGSIEYVNGAVDQIRHSNGYITLDKGLTTEHLILSGTETIDNVYESLSTISDHSIPDPRITTYKAEEFIVLTPGFQVDTGAVFSAQIDTFPVVGLDYRYFIKDHLGNIRVEFEDNGSGSAVTVSYHNYYPYGMRWEDSTSDTKNNYFYNGKELQKSFDLGYLNYGARFYDPSVGRFMGVDAIADHPNQVDKSPYAYAWNNPISLNDPDGNCPICPYIVGAIGGAALDYAVQVGTNLYEGKGTSSFTDVDGGSILFSAGAGATGVGLASKAGKLFNLIKGGTKVDDAVSIGSKIANSVDDIGSATTKLEDLASQATKLVDDATGQPVKGTKIHSEFQKLIKSEFGDRAATEVSFKGGQVVKSGTKGSIRIDALITGPKGKPIGIFDLKTGKAGLTPGRINQIRSQLPDALKNVPIKKIR